MKRWRITILCPLCLVAPALARAQATEENSPAAALSSAMAAACRQNQDAFGRYLTSENAAAFRELPANLRTEMMKRLVAVGEAGSPLLSSRADGVEVLRCSSPASTAELRMGAARVRENLAFVPVEIPGERNLEFGLVREGGGWKLLSVGLLLLNVPELSRQWAAQELESREARVIAALRELAEAIATYRRGFGVLPESLEQLGPAPKEGISPERAKLVDEELASGKKFGYIFRYRILPGAGDEAARFELAATPAEYGRAGRRSFFLDSSGTLRGADKQGAVATIADPRIEERRPSPRN